MIVGADVFVLEFGNLTLCWCTGGALLLGRNKESYEILYHVCIYVACIQNNDV